MRYLVGMSGGLDSTYTVKMLLERGHEVCGAVLDMQPMTDIAAARQSAEAFGIPLHVINCRESFENDVITPFTEAYLSGKTPNPCVFCNPKVKFKYLCDFAGANGFDKACTGHYCGIGYENGRYYIKRAHDTKKDQSYFLWGLSQEQLRILEFPLFSEEKSEIKGIASEAGLAAAEREESQEICFISPGRSYIDFIEERRGKLPPGNFIDTAGNVVGRHGGILRYTVGQRKKLGIALGKPVYVTKIDPDKNTVTVADTGGEYFSSIKVCNLNFQMIDSGSCETSFEAQVKVRHSSSESEAAVLLDIVNDTAYVKFKNNTRAPTPGQSAVFYLGGKILFGGIIEEIPAI